MALAAPFNIQKWIDENRHLLKPPVGNQQIFKISDDFIVMVVGGPNSRKDYHYEEGEELFYQLEGDITIYIQEDGVKKAMKLSSGDMYLHPAKIPHSPNRSENSIGLVIEKKRAGKGFTDGLLWFCDNCNHKLYDTYFELNNIEKDFLPHFKHFYNSEKLRTCINCGTQMKSDPRFIDEANAYDS